MKWVTWEEVGVDRMACAWLIRRFIDPDAEFLFVPAGQSPLPPCALRLIAPRQCGVVSPHTPLDERRFWGILGCPERCETRVFGSKQGVMTACIIRLMRMGNCSKTPIASCWRSAPDGR